MRRSTLVTKLTFRMLKMESQRGYVEKIFTLSELYTTWSASIKMCVRFLRETFFMFTN